MPEPAKAITVQNVKVEDGGNAIVGNVPACERDRLRQDAGTQDADAEGRERQARA